MSACGVCPSFCLSVTFVSYVKTNKDIFDIFSPSGSQAILVFRAKQDGDIPTGTPLTGASNAGVVGKKRDYGRVSGFAAYRSTVRSTVRVANCEKQSRDERRQASNRSLTAASVVRRPLFAQDDDEVFVTGWTLYAGNGGHPPDTTPLVITPFSAVVRHRRTKPGEYFC